jgi:plastocyanin
MKRTFGALVLAAITATAGCGDDSDDASADKAPQARGAALRITDTSTPGNWSFDKKRLTAKAGRVTIELHNGSGLGHNVRVHTGKCCFKPGFKDLGGTEVIGATNSDRRNTIKATLELEPGTYTFLCSIPGHFQAGQRGTLVVS